MMFSGFNSVLLIKLLEQRFHILPQGAQADALHQVPGLLRRAAGQVQTACFPPDCFSTASSQQSTFYRVPGSFSTVALIVSHS